MKLHHTPTLKTLLAAALAVSALSATAQSTEPVKIGLLSTLSGPGAGLGIDIRDGFQLAIKLGGGKLGGRPAEVIIADDQASPDVGRQTADRLVKRDKVDFMTGVVFSNVMLAVGAPTFQSKTFYVSANAGPSQYAELTQLDYGAELSQLRASKPDAVYIFLPGGLGINFIKQFVGAGLSKDMTLFGPGFSGDEDVIKAVGEPMLGMFNTSQWAHDLDNAANKKFVAAFEKEFGRLPSLYAAQGYDAAKLIDAAVRDSKGKLEDKAAVRKALEAAKFDSVRGAFKFNVNHYPIQDYYLRVITKNAKGQITNRTIGTVFKNHADAYAGSCKMPS